jgi:hypothetical protein
MRINSNPSSMGWNLAWYVPLVVLTLLVIVRVNLRFLWDGLAATYRHFSFFLFISPAFDFWMGIMIALPLIPIWALVFVYQFVAQRHDGSIKHPYIASAVVIVGSIMACEILLFLAAHSWPFLADAQGRERIRMFPLIGCSGCYDVR